MCCEFLKRQLDPSNCLGIRAFADTHACRDLLRVADKFAQHNFVEVIDHEEFLLLPLGQLIEICSSDELNVRSEEQVYQAIMVWVKHSIVERRQHLPVVSTLHPNSGRRPVSRFVFVRNIFFLLPDSPTRQIAPALAQVPRGDGRGRHAHQVRRRVSRPRRRGQELPTPPAGTATHARTEDETQEAHSSR